MEWYKPFILVMGYGLYAVVCGYYNNVLIPGCCPIRESSKEENLHHIKSIEHEIKSTISSELDLCEQGDLL
jgi:hypothetical protein